MLGSLKVNRLLTAFVVPVLVASCIGGPGNAGVAWIRNESSEPVAVAIDHTTHSGLLPGSAHIDLDVPPWQEGWCAAMGYGINAGPLTIAVSGPTVPFPISTTIAAPDTPQTEIFVLVDAKGEVHFDRTAPESEMPCQSYGQVLEPSSP